MNFEFRQGSSYLFMGLVNLANSIPAIQAYTDNNLKYKKITDPKIYGKN